MEEKDRTLGLRSVVSISVGLVIATSCLVSLGQGTGSIGIVFIGAMVIACLLNMTTVASLSELRHWSKDHRRSGSIHTGLSRTIPHTDFHGGWISDLQHQSSGVEATIFSYAMASTIHLPIPSILYTLVMTVVVMIANLYGVDMFAKIQDLVAFLLVGSMLIMGIIGMFGLGTGAMVQQPYSMAADWKEVVSMVAVAFWLFIGAEYVIPVSRNVKS